MAAVGKTTIDCTKVLVDIDGDAMKMNNKDMTVGRVIAVSLLNEQEKKTPDDLVDVYVTAMNVCNESEYELSDNEVAAIERAVSVTQARVVAGQVIKYVRDQQIASKA